MSTYDLQVLDTLETADYLGGELASDGSFFQTLDLDIPAHMVPPNPDDSDSITPVACPSHPYGNPTNVRHPASRPRPPYDPSSRAEDMGYDGGSVNGASRWRDLATEHLLPVDEEKEAKRAIEARKMANGGTPNATAPQPEWGKISLPKKTMAKKTTRTKMKLKTLRKWKARWTRRLILVPVCCWFIVEIKIV
ncbi:hypothetical protein K438DRAFT_2151088 [Mycena galopus ATCC 62051]|nr:hypothetical protein K438DRAFT_2151088 [Mycena galopus ATCC 62051]